MRGPDRETHESAQDPLDRRDRLYQRARGLPEEERSAFLAEQCGDDAELRAELESLLSHAVEAEAFMEALGRLGDEPARASDVVDRLNAILEGRYRIEGEVGSGGMATVYLAEDLRHERKVAVKVLKPELAAMVGADRFLTEIKTTANLQHPHILPLHDSGEADGFLYYVMPYVEGESLRDRLDREHQLPVEDAVRIARAVAAGLDHAHRQGVVHRDIKPANILLQDGEPLVGDFGIALALSTLGGTRLTKTGVGLGTPAYMSPEQATGQGRVDARSDIYSLGCVAYEMLTGDSPFAGASAQVIAARILAEVPRPLRSQRHTIPEHVENAVLVALEKLPADRFRTAQAFADALESPHGAAGVATYRKSRKSAPRRREVSHRAVVLGLGVVTLASLGLAAGEWLVGRQATPAAVVEFGVHLPGDLHLAVPDPFGNDLVISPDGATLAFAATNAQGTRRLYTRRLSDRTVRSLPGTEGAYRPRFSPNGDWIVFSSEGRIQKVSVRGGAPQIITDYAYDGGLAWIRGDRILVSRQGRLFSIPSSGGAPRLAAALDTLQGETAQTLPTGVGDGEHVLYTSWSQDVPDSARIGIAWLSKKRSRRLDLQGTYALGMLGDQLIYSDQSGTLLAATLDLDAGLVTGLPVPIARDVMVGSRGAAVATLSASGTLVYLAGRREAKMMLADSAGATPVSNESRSFAYPRYSPDGRRLAVAILSGSGSDIWLYDLGMGTRTRLEGGGLVNDRPEWTPDGRHVIYRSDRGGGFNSSIWMGSTDGSTPPVPLLEDETRVRGYFEAVMTPDARALVYQVEGAGNLQISQADVEYRMLDGDTTPHPIASTRRSETAARLSPDGRWLAYVTEEFDEAQVVVQPFPGPRGRIQVSRNGGAEPVWAPDSRRLFYRSGGKFVVADLSATPSLHVASRADFMDDVFLRAAGPHANYDVAPDGEKLLVLKGEEPEFVWLQNWGATVRSLLEQENAR